MGTNVSEEQTAYNLEINGVITQKATKVEFRFFAAPCDKSPWGEQQISPFLLTI
jgi:hypothetical protein